MRKSAIIPAVLILLSLVSCRDDVSESSQKYDNENILGEWYSGEIGGSFYFDDDNNFSLRVDVTGTMATTKSS